MTDVQEGKRSPCNTTTHSSSVHGEDSEQWAGMSPSATLYGPDLPLPSIEVYKGSDGRSVLCDQRGNAEAACCLRTTENEFYLKRIFKLDNSGKNALIRMGISQSEYSVQMWQTCSVFQFIPSNLKLICKWLSVQPFSLKVSFHLTHSPPPYITQLSVMHNTQNCIPVVTGSINLCVKHRTHFY